METFTTTIERLFYDPDPGQDHDIDTKVHTLHTLVHAAPKEARSCLAQTAACLLHDLEHAHGKSNSVHAAQLALGVLFPSCVAVQDLHSAVCSGNAGAVATFLQENTGRIHVRLNDFEWARTALTWHRVVEKFRGPSDGHGADPSCAVHGPDHHARDVHTQPAGEQHGPPTPGGDPLRSY